MHDLTGRKYDSTWQDISSRHLTWQWKNQKHGKHMEKHPNLCYRYLLQMMFSINVAIKTVFFPIRWVDFRKIFIGNYGFSHEIRWNMGVNPGKCSLTVNQSFEPWLRQEAEERRILGRQEAEEARPLAESGARCPGWHMWIGFHWKNINLAKFDHDLTVLPHWNHGLL